MEIKTSELRLCEHCKEMVPLKCADPSGNLDSGFCEYADGAGPNGLEPLKLILSPIREAVREMVERSDWDSYWTHKLHTIDRVIESVPDELEG